MSSQLQMGISVIVNTYRQKHMIQISCSSYHERSLKLDNLTGDVWQPMDSVLLPLLPSETRAAISTPAAGGLWPPWGSLSPQSLKLLPPSQTRGLLFTTGSGFSHCLTHVSPQVLIVHKPISLKQISRLLLMLPTHHI